MKKLLKRTSVITALLLGIIPFFSLSALAENDLDDSGKMRVKIERIGQDETDPEKLESQDVEETELEKLAPGLFSEQTRAAIEAKQKELAEKDKEFKESLFVSQVKKDTTLKDLEKRLFSDDYEVQSFSVALQNNNQNGEENNVSKGVIVAIFGFVLIISGGIYLMMKKMVK